MKEILIALLGSSVTLARPVYLYFDRYTSSANILAKQLQNISDAGVSHIILGNYYPGMNLENDASDALANWVNIPEKERSEIANTLKEKGTNMMMTTGGDEMGLKILMLDPDEFGKKYCERAIAWNMIGVDFNLQGFFWAHEPQLTWMVNATKACRAVMPKGLIFSSPRPSVLESLADVDTQRDNWMDVVNRGSIDKLLIQRFNQDTYDDYTYDGQFLSKHKIGLESLYRRYPHVKKDFFALSKPYLMYHTYKGGYVLPNVLKQQLCKAEKEIGYEGGLAIYKAPMTFDVLDDLTMLTAPCPPFSTDTADFDNSHVPANAHVKLIRDTN